MLRVLGTESACSCKSSPLSFVQTTIPTQSHLPCQLGNLHDCPSPALESFCFHFTQFAQSPSRRPVTHHPVVRPSSPIPSGAFQQPFHLDVLHCKICPFLSLSLLSLPSRLPPLLAHAAHLYPISYFSLFSFHINPQPLSPLTTSHYMSDERGCTRRRSAIHSPSYY